MATESWRDRREDRKERRRKISEYVEAARRRQAPGKNSRGAKRIMRQIEAERAAQGAQAPDLHNSPE